VVCDAVLEWKNTIEVESSSLVTQSASERTATAFLQAVLKLTDRMLAQVRAVGSPAAENGPNVQGDVVRRLSEARSALVRVRSGITRLVAEGNVVLTREVELPILSAVEAIESDLRNPTGVEIARTTVSNADCFRLFRRKAPIGTGA
jgi:hypothetical protein